MSFNDVAPCDHEEGDTRIFVHAKSAVSYGSKSLMIKASDTDIVVPAVSVFSTLQEMGLDLLWITFG